MAGAEPPLIVKSNGETIPLETGGPPIGVSETATYTTERFRLDFNDTIIMTTDGITEARRGTEIFGYDRLAASAVYCVDAPLLKKAAGGLMSSVRAFAGGFRDDVALLLARRRR